MWEKSLKVVIITYAMNNYQVCAWGPSSKSWEGVLLQYDVTSEQVVTLRHGKSFHGRIFILRIFVEIRGINVGFFIHEIGLYGDICCYGKRTFF